MYRTVTEPLSHSVVICINALYSCKTQIQFKTNNRGAHKIWIVIHNVSNCQ